MKKVVAFLLAFLIFVSPVTTLVKADVVIGDNDETIINENASVLGRKLALMESLSDLALSGVTEFTISNTNDVDSYLDSLWSELNDALDSLSDGTGFTEISDTLKSKYFTNLVQYKDYINNRGEYLANLLPSGSPTTSLLSTFFANNIFGKHSTLQSNTSLNAFRALSQRGSVTPTPSPNPNYAQYIDNINGNGFWWKNYSNINYYNHSKPGMTIFPPNLLTWFTVNTDGSYLFTNYAKQTYSWACDITTIYIYSNNGQYSYNVTINGTKKTFLYDNDSGYLGEINSNGTFALSSLNSSKDGYVFTFTGTLENCFQQIQAHFKNVNIYVDGDPWSIVSDDTDSNPILDIDGLLKIFGNNNTPQYQLQPNTKIDYDQLYQVIYNAIRDNLPISQGDINYYDSHDTIYSPTIINNYGEEEGDESDLIDTILDYAVIPKFDTSIAQPMRAALTNGVVIMNNSITNVIPDEILFILGACFFLLLFAVVINRMIK